MELFSRFSDFLTGSVGNNLDNNADDVRQTKRSLSDLGYFDEDTSNPIITHKMDVGIKNFQKDNDLKVDGRLNPNGETERKLFETLIGKGADNIFKQLENNDDSVDLDENVNRTFVPPKPQHKPKPDNPFGYDDDILALVDKPAQTDATGRMVQLERQRTVKTPPKTKQKPTPEVQKALNEAESKLKYFDKNNRHLSSKFLRHYLGKSGDSLEISPQDMEKASLYRKAIKINQKRFEDSLAKGVVDRTYEWHGNAMSGEKGTASAFKGQILKLKDGETITLNNPKIKDAGDSWDRDIGRLHSAMVDKDHGQAIGAVKLRSLGNLQATRKDNKIEITGEVDHKINDTYDFNDDTLFDKVTFEKYRLLEQKGYAKIFEVHGNKKQKMTGTMEIKNGYITNPKFKWEDRKE